MNTITEHEKMRQQIMATRSEYNMQTSLSGEIIALAAAQKVLELQVANEPLNIVGSDSRDAHQALTRVLNRLMDSITY